MRAKRIDLTQNDIVKYFRSRGCSVAVTSSLGNGFPDLVVSWGLDRNYLIEVKTGNQDLTTKEQGFMEHWAGQYCIIRSVEEAQLFFEGEIKNDRI